MRSRRLYTIDALRGLMIIVLTLNHMKGHPLMVFTFEPIGYFGAAEGFVFLSGLLAGFIYGRSSNSRAVLFEKVANRASMITACWMLLIVGIPLLRHISGWTMGPALSVDSFTFPNPLGSNEVLGLYCGLFFLMFPVLLLLRNRRFGVLMLISVGLYLLAFYPALHSEFGLLQSDIGSRIARVILFLSGNVSSPFGEGYDGYRSVGFVLIAWQLLFVCALAIGYSMQHGIVFSLLRGRKMFWVLGLCCLGVALVRWLRVDLSFLPDELLKKELLGVVRLVSFALFSGFIFAVSIRLKPEFRVRSLELLGRNSLPVYVFQTLLVFGVLNHHLLTMESRPLKGLILLGTCLSLFLVGTFFDRDSRLESWWVSLGVASRLKRAFGMPEELDWKRRLAFTGIAFYLVLSLVNLVQLREDFPFTSATMFARHIDSNTPLYAVRLYADDGDPLDLRHYGLSKRILLYSIYCGDEDDSPYYNPACLKEAYPERLERWFIQLNSRYIENHGESPQGFRLQLEPTRAAFEVVRIADYNCLTGKLTLADDSLDAVL